MVRRKKLFFKKNLHWLPPKSMQKILVSACPNFWCRKSIRHNGRANPQRSLWSPFWNFGNAMLTASFVKENYWSQTDINQPPPSAWLPLCFSPLREGREKKGRTKRAPSVFWVELYITSKPIIIRAQSRDLVKFPGVALLSWVFAWFSPNNNKKSRNDAVGSL